MCSLSTRVGNIVNTLMAQQMSRVNSFLLLVDNVPRESSSDTKGEKATPISYNDNQEHNNTH